MDWDGNELLLSDILGTDEDIIYRDLENEVERNLLLKAINKLTDRERTIIRLRFGLGHPDGLEMTQKEVASLLGISQSYISLVLDQYGFGLLLRVRSQRADHLTLPFQFQRWGQHLRAAYVMNISLFAYFLSFFPAKHPHWDIHGDRRSQYHNLIPRLSIYKFRNHTVGSFSCGAICGPSVGKPAGTLIGFPVKDMEVEVGGIRRKCREIYIAIWQDRLSETGSYDILLQPAMLEL